ncbi:MAG: 23S rRNA (adenine(2503)-C(2))-methyltransferase RlmN [Bacteroidales bacterium]|nr:23S rRNA (adenine(2503)-C(2))-methyltransferase RlmN [Bacteroidales bacterium]MDD4671088.1 23S rRNA (adenine(2503)-C(2))-methyltransferase RlmN [Bacteroidales bacterium]
MKERILGRNLLQLREITDSLSLPSFTAGQIAGWLYKKQVDSIDQMTNISKHARELLNERYEVGKVEYIEKLVSSDGTKKYLFPTRSEGRYIESVMIPEYEGDTSGEIHRATICVSSQVGCKMNCRFCMTARGGFHGNLDSGEILSQFLKIDESADLTNAVFMGMGEPLDNWENVRTALEILTAEWGFGWSPKRITLSTIGVIPKLELFLNESKCHLAVSLHNPFDEERSAMMPVQKRFRIEDVVELIKKYDFTGQRRVSFEYIMFAGLNDSKRHADALLRLLKGLECRINLIRFHTIPDSPYVASPMQTIDFFRERLNKGGITTTLRASRGEDILAACGLLAGKNNY